MTAPFPVTIRLLPAVKLVAAFATALLLPVRATEDDPVIEWNALAIAWPPLSVTPPNAFILSVLPAPALTSVFAFAFAVAPPAWALASANPRPTLRPPPAIVIVMPALAESVVFALAS